jgi:transcriptional regulator
MYNFSYFKENDQRIIREFLETYPFALITGISKEGSMVATQIPLLVEERAGEIFLHGHIMRNTDHHKAYCDNSVVMVVFSGPNAYVSASWYSDPQIGSTWNYMAVHIQGEIRFMTDKELSDFMHKLTLKFEDGNKISPTVYDNLPEQYLSKMMPAIVGIEIRVLQLENVFKLSQNRDEESYLNIIAKLQERGGFNRMIAHEMEKRLELLFPRNTNQNKTKPDT